MSETQFVTAEDGVRLAFDISGDGPALILLHGAGEGHTRRIWHKLGYVDRLKEQFTVITMDARGHGESDQPENSEAYSIDRMCQDILDVADAAGVDKFIIWGFSYGGNIGRFLAARSERVRKFVMIGIPMGLAASGEFRQFINNFKAKWDPILQAQQAGSLDLDSLDQEDREDLEEVKMAVFVAWITAMLSWGSIDPADLLCPTLWMSGTENPGTMASMREHQAKLEDSLVETKTFEGLNHQQELSEIDVVFPSMLAFALD